AKVNSINTAKGKRVTSVVGEQEVTTADIALNTASVPISTASATLEVSTAAANLVYIRRSVEKRKDKEHIDEDERKRIARDAEIAKQLQEEYDKAGKKEAVAEVDTAHVIDWNDPSVIRYLYDLVNTSLHTIDHEIGTRNEKERVVIERETRERPRSIAKVRKNMLMYLKNQGGYKMKDFKVMSYDDIRPIFEKGDLVKLWSLVQERYNSSGLTKDKEIELWVELKMLFKPDAKNLLELQKYMHDPLKWWLYDMCAVHHVSTKKGQDIFMLVEKDYPLTNGLTTLMLCNKLRVDQQSEMADELLIKII
ncbi:hypothetical protein Tco_1026557, partial [Tanacetum coccineum]